MTDPIREAVAKAVLEKLRGRTIGYSEHWDADLLRDIGDAYEAVRAAERAQDAPPDEPSAEAKRFAEEVEIVFTDRLHVKAHFHHTQTARNVAHALDAFAARAVAAAQQKPDASNLERATALAKRLPLITAPQLAKVQVGTVTMDFRPQLTASQVIEIIAGEIAEAVAGERERCVRELLAMTSSYGSQPRTKALLDAVATLRALTP